MRVTKNVVLDYLGTWVGLLVAVAIGMIVGFVAVLLTSSEPLYAIQVFLTGPFSSVYWLGTTINRAIPLIFVGLGIAIAFKARVFNIGAQGQFYLGALAGTLVGVFIGLPPVLHVLTIVLVSALAGGLYAFLPGLFKARWGTNEIVTTLMFNFIAIHLVSYLLANGFQDKAANYNVSPEVRSSARLPEVMSPSPLHAGVFLAVLAVVLSYLFLDRSVFGYKLRLSGINPDFSRYGGINRGLIIVGAITLSGALAGLGGGIRIIGVQGKLTEGFLPMVGYDAINISLIARNNPLGVIPAALFFGYLGVGGEVAGILTDLSPHVVNLIKAGVFYLVTAQALFQFVKGLIERNPEEVAE
ncbi:MAG: ABC transporter permease [Candidatus Acetothermia bacterium]